MKKQSLEAILGEQISAQVKETITKELQELPKSWETSEKKQQKWLRRKDAALLLGVHVNTIDNWSRWGFIRKRYIGGTPFIHIDDLLNKK